MDKFPETTPVNESEAQRQLSAFREQIHDIVEQEKRGEIPGKHLVSDTFNPADLTPEDMSIWEKVQSGAITEDDLRAYQKLVAGGAKIETGQIPTDSRSLFSGFITNVVGEMLMRRELEEERKRKTP